MSHATQGGELKRELKNRHIQLIALGGAVGTGLFLGSASVLKAAGPSMILGYAIAGFIAFLIMRQLGEMIAEEPVAGSFSHFAFKYWGPFPAMVAGWTYWLLYVLAGMAELTAVGAYVQYWWPHVPTWLTALVCFLAINGLNLASVKSYGETEFWFGLIKIVAVIAMILFGGYLLATGSGGPQAGVHNLWSHGGFFPHGFTGLFMMMAPIMFSFGGLELIGMTAGEAANPQKVIPRAVNQIIVRILVFYIGSLTVLLSLYPWSEVASGGSPFVMIFQQIGAGATAHVLNFVVMTAALSVYNSGVYANSRMLYSLAEQGNAPRALKDLDRRGVPVKATLFSAACTFLGVVLNYVLPEEAFGILMSMVVMTIVTNWAMISLAHLKFRRAKAGQQLVFPSIWFPAANYLCLAFMVMILGILLFTPGGAISVYLLPVWVGVLWLGFRMRKTDSAAELASQQV
ncbi:MULTISPECIES: amino acid permease [unclassified Paludibacterium]|uniref:amino acid permease n=1 Tax=unclassified Paludibacterium TaxID=2618429 RepID=UPI001C057F65|nr:amino acid permease [Paludibacterium sp. B53371]BEV73264.1 aromatic amino acid transporter AroP [Paludibacterium sp. THUN1379]